MIYEFPGLNDPIRQGDIFTGLPRIDMSLSMIPIVTVPDKQIVSSWDEILKAGGSASAILDVKPVSAIVITQDCDALRANDVTLCEIDSFRNVAGESKNANSAKSWMEIITRHAKLNLKWFYLPPDDRIGFSDRMGVDFFVTIRIQRHELENFRILRKAKLNEIATQHFRERLSGFFRRYPYDEWYPLDKEEFSEYQKKHQDAEPFPWQE